MSDLLTSCDPDPNTEPDRCGDDGRAVVPMERLEARICELAGHLTAATCQFLLLVADFDARQGWASWEMPSCAAWLSWKCQIAPGTAREQVRVARALGQFPVIRDEFAAARLSYAKVRALTRIATPETENDLAEMASPMTAEQLERFARAHRRVSRDQEEQARARRKFSWHWVDDFEFAFRGLLPPEEAGVMLQALRAFMNDLEHPHDDHDHDGGDDGVSAETRAGKLKRQDEQDGISWDEGKPPPIRKDDAGDLATALVGICAAYLGERAAHTDNPDTYQVIIHAGTGAITAPAEPGAPEPGRPEPESAGVSAETRPGDSGGSSPRAGRAAEAPADTSPARALAALKETVPQLAFPVSHPAHPMRCHVEDGLAISPATAQMIACDATISTLLHDADGSILNAGRRSRKPPAALRRAARERDRYRCRFPGCESRRIDLHHILFWANGGQTKLENIICLCKRHHRLVHDKGIIIAAVSDGFAFHLADGTHIPSSPPLPASSPGAITACHGAAITAGTIIPPNSGGRLDLHMAIWIAFTNAENQAKRREQGQHEQREPRTRAQAA